MPRCLVEVTSRTSGRRLRGLHVPAREEDRRDDAEANGDRDHEGESARIGILGRHHGVTRGPLVPSPNGHQPLLRAQAGP
jgi:hypothetical protein